MLWNIFCEWGEGRALFICLHILQSSFTSFIGKNYIKTDSSNEGLCFVLFFFLFLYFSYRIAEYLLVSNGSEIHCSKTMYFIVFIVLRQKYISKQAPELKKDEKKKDKEKRCYTLQYCSQSQDPLYTIYYLIKKSCIQFSWFHNIIMLTLTNKYLVK